MENAVNQSVKTSLAFWATDFRKEKNICNQQSARAKPIKKTFGWLGASDWWSGVLFFWKEKNKL